MLYVGIILGVTSGLAIGALLSQAKISDMELQIAFLKKRCAEDEKIV
ncbi:MAG: hypothetical protein IJL87_05455 [Clostridia bacterium]|nr:hypothetical protein [Clostridia bacterium]